MSEEKGQERGFQVKDKRLSSKSEEEKEQLIKQEEVKTAAGTMSEPEKSPPRDQQAGGSLPEVNFSALVFSLSTQAVIQLGEMEDPLTKQKDPNIPQAKQTIDILEMLKEKTEGNLTPEEQSLLDNLLYDLRMRYVKVCNPKNSGLVMGESTVS